MATIRDGYLYLNNNDKSDIGTVEDILGELANEADPFIADLAATAQDALKSIFDYTKMKYEASVGESMLPIYESESYDSKGRMRE